MTLYGILDLGYVAAADAERVTAALLAGGVSYLQLRAKGKDLALIEELARRVLPLCRAAKVPFILNDHAALAAAVDADGLHLGQDDGSLAEARTLTGPKMLIGRSTHSLEQARARKQHFDWAAIDIPRPAFLGTRAFSTEMSLRGAGGDEAI